MARDKTDKNPAATGAVNEWGIPDWRDASAYGDVKRWTFYRWRWEFYRRREDLRQCFEIGQSQETPEMAFMFKGRPPSGHPGHYVQVGGKIGRFFGYRYELPDPSVSNHPEDMLFAYDDEFPPAMRHWERSDESCATINLPMTRKNHAAYVFDLDKPLEPQVQVAMRSMKRTQKELHGKVLQSRRYPKRYPARWLGYLRTLDARAEGLSWAEITDAFFAEGLMNRRKNPSGGYCAPPPQAARDMWDAANALRFNF